MTRKSTATAGATIARANRWSFALLGLVRCSRTLRSFGSASALVFVLVVCVIEIGGLDPKELRDKECSICVAGGKSKHAAVRAGLIARYYNVLVTDEQTASFLLKK